MSLKAAADKAWNLPGKDSSRRFLPGSHLIVTEGVKTEPLYFAMLKRVIRKNTGTDAIWIAGLGRNTTGLFRAAKELSGKAGYPFEHVWLVYDKDDFPAEHFNRVVELCENENRRNEETVFHAIWSNQCIELWYLLHFSYFQSDIHRSFYSAKLSILLGRINAGNYQKNREDMFPVLLPLLDNAIRNAEKLDEWNKGRTPADSAPGTQMHVMLSVFRPYLTADNENGSEKHNPPDRYLTDLRN